MIRAVRQSSLFIERSPAWHTSRHTAASTPQPGPVPRPSLSAAPVLLRRVEAPGEGRSSELVEQRPRLFQVLSAEAFGEPAVDRGEEVAGFGAAALTDAQAGEGHGSAQFPQFRLLLAGDPESFATQSL